LSTRPKIGEIETVMIERAKFIFKFDRSKQGRPAFLSNRRFSYAWNRYLTSVAVAPKLAPQISNEDEK
jgi:hypothetical protein